MRLKKTTFYTFLVIILLGTQVKAQKTGFTEDLPARLPVNLPVSQYTPIVATPVRHYKTWFTTQPAEEPAVLKAINIIRDYINTIGGTAELKKATSSVVTMTMVTQDRKLDVVVKKMAPNMDAMTVTKDGNVLIKEVFDGNKGYKQQGGGVDNMTADEVAQKKAFSNLTEQLDYLSNPNFKLVYKGIQKVNDLNAYLIEITDPAGKITSEYYDVKSKLLVRQENTFATGADNITQTLRLGDYRKVGNILFPFKQIQTKSINGDDLVFVMKVTDVKMNTGVTAADFK